MKKSDIGRRVKIVDASGHKLGYFMADNPHPEHIGKLGTIIKLETISLRNFQHHSSPLIKLDDGTELGGWECWWTFMENT